MKSKKILYLLIVGSMIVSYLIGNYLMNDVFIAQTPQIRPHLRENLIAQLEHLTKDNFIAAGIDKQRVKNAENNLQNVPLQQLAKGVYAKENNKISYKLVNENEVQYILYTFNIKGKIIRIKVPAGDKPPSVQLLEKIY